MAADDGLNEIREEALRDPRAHASAWFATESNTKDTMFAAERIADAVERAGDDQDARFKQLTQFLNTGPLWSLPSIEKLLRSIRTVLILILLAVVANVVFAGERSRAVRAEFQRQHPCPATQAKRGPCRGYEVDHIQPLCAGGRDELPNLQWLSVHDHRLKTKKDVAGCFERVYKPEPAAAE